MAGPPPVCGRPPNPRPDGVWRPLARRASAPPPSIGGRTRAGSSGASGAAAVDPVYPRRRLPDADFLLRPRSGRLLVLLSLDLADPGRPGDPPAESPS